MQYFYGEDLYEIQKAIENLVTQKQATVTWLAAIEVMKNRDWRDRLAAGPSLFEKKVTVLRDVSVLPSSIQTELSQFLKTNDLADLLIWDSVTPDKRTALFKTLKTNAREYKYPEDQVLIKQLQALATEQEGSIEPSAAKLLLERVGKNGWRLRSEMARLLLQSETITKDLIEQEIPPSPQAEIFRTIEAMAAGQGKLAVQQVLDLLQTGQSEFYILSMMAYQFKTLYLVKTGQSGAAKLHPYVVQKSEALTRRFSANQLLDILTRILAVDVAIKQGKMEPRTGLTMTVLGLVA